MRRSVTVPSLSAATCAEQGAHCAVMYACSLKMCGHCINAPWQLCLALVTC